jgi:hypothetical protein
MQKEGEAKHILKAETGRFSLHTSRCFPVVQKQPEEAREFWILKIKAHATCETHKRDLPRQAA